MKCNTYLKYVGEDGDTINFTIPEDIIRSEKLLELKEEDEIQLKQKW